MDEDAFFAKFTEESRAPEESLRRIYMFVDGAPWLGLTRRKLAVRPP